MSESQTLVQGLFLKHTDVIRGYIRGLMPDRVRADDVLQETFLTVTRKADDFDPATNFAKWACTIARYKVLEERRTMAKADGMLTPEVMEALAVTEEAFSRDPRMDRLPECLKRLPDGSRRLITLRYQDDHEPSEIAGLIGWSPDSVYVSLSRARGLLRKCIEGQLNPTPAKA